MSLKEIIYNHIKSEYPKIIHKGIIGRKAVLEWGYENENAGRRCRDLVAEGKILKVENAKHEAQYQWIPPKEYIPAKIPSVQTKLFITK